MKKHLLLTACLILAGTSLSAQTAHHSHPRTTDFYGGLTFGVNIANMAKFDGGDALARFNAGFTGGYRFSDLFAVQAELLYSGSGTSLHLKGEINDVKVDDVIHLNLNYINVPVLAKFYPVGGFNIYAGVQVGFLVSQKFNYHNEKERSDLDLHKVDCAIPLGLGYDFTHFQIGVRYQQGLVDIFRDESEKNRNNNTLLAINIGYKF